MIGDAGHWAEPSLRVKATVKVEHDEVGATPGAAVGDSVERVAGAEVAGDPVGDVVGDVVVGEVVGEVDGDVVVGDPVGAEVIGELVGEAVGDVVVGEHRSRSKSNASQRQT